MCAHASRVSCALRHVQQGRLLCQGCAVSTSAVVVGVETAATCAWSTDAHVRSTLPAGPVLLLQRPCMSAWLVTVGACLLSCCSAGTADYVCCSEPLPTQYAASVGHMVVIPLPPIRSQDVLIHGHPAARDDGEQTMRLETAAQCKASAADVQQQATGSCNASCNSAAADVLCTYRSVQQQQQQQQQQSG